MWERDIFLSFCSKTWSMCTAHFLSAGREMYGTKAGTPAKKERGIDFVKTMCFGYCLSQKLLWITVKYSNVAILIDTQLQAGNTITEKQSWGSNVFVPVLFFNNVIPLGDLAFHSNPEVDSLFWTASHYSSIKERVVPRPAKFMAASAWSRNTLGSKGNFLVNNFVRSFSVLEFKAENHGPRRAKRL